MYIYIYDHHCPQNKFYLLDMPSMVFTTSGIAFLCSLATSFDLPYILVELDNSPFSNSPYLLLRPYFSHTLSSIWHTIPFVSKPTSHSKCRVNVTSTWESSILHNQKELNLLFNISLFSFPFFSDSLFSFMLWLSAFGSSPF